MKEITFRKALQKIEFLHYNEISINVDGGKSKGCLYHQGILVKPTGINETAYPKEAFRYCNCIRKKIEGEMRITINNETYKVL